MKPAHRFNIVLCVLFFGIVQSSRWSTAAEPYDTRRFGGRGLQHEVLLLMNDVVQEEIDVTAAQKPQLDEFRTEFGKSLSESRPMPKASPETPEQWEKYNRETLESYARAWNEIWPREKKVLSEQQIARLQQILVQCRGIAGLDDPSTSEKLALTPPQKKSLSAIREEHIRRLQDLFAERDSMVAEELQQSVLSLERERDADTLLVLTDDQRATFEKLKGQPFELGRIRNGPFSNGVFGPRRKSDPAN